MRLLVLLLALFAWQPLESVAQWSAGPGETVRNAFGPQKNEEATACRGACGLGCPTSCDEATKFECAGGARLLRVRTFSCGTHQACRDHDDCLDRCSQDRAEGFDCQAECHAEVMEQFPVENSVSWMAGGGPYDGDPILFEYTREQPGWPEAFYRCPEGSALQCAADGGRCVAGQKPVDPVFTNYRGGMGGVLVSGFRSGDVCTEGGEPASVCQTAVDIRVTGEDECLQAEGVRPCTWFGFEFDYRNANPGEPLYCQSTGTAGDFLGEMVSKAIEAAPAEDDSDLGKLLGSLQKELNSGKSLDQVFSGISITTEDGQVLGGEAPVEALAQPGVPGEVAVNSASGHLLVPIFELRDAQPPGTTVEHQVRCVQQGRPVVETTFRLHFARK